MRLGYHSTFGELVLSSHDYQSNLPHQYFYCQGTRKQWQHVYIVTAAICAIGVTQFAIFACAELQSWARDPSTEDTDENVSVSENTTTTWWLFSRNCPLIARFMGPIWDPPGTDKAQVGSMLAPWTLLSGICYSTLRTWWRLCALVNWITDGSWNDCSLFHAIVTNIVLSIGTLVNI